MSLISKLKKLYVKAFVGGQWQVGYRKRSDNTAVFETVVPPEGMWIADPFVYEANGEHYLFVELFEKAKNKAGIGYYRFIDDKPVFQGKIIEQPYHMSYPCVFEFEGEQYMIPETSAGCTLDLYRAVNFPDQWELDTNLLTDVKYVDTTVVKLNGNFYAFTYGKEGREWKFKLFALDMQQKKLEAIAEKTYSTNIGRPAGYFSYAGGLRRPAQDCSRKYGEALLIYQIDKMEKNGLEEHIVGTIHANKIPLSKSADRIHTYTCDDTYEVVDVYYEKLDLLHGFMTFRRVILKK